MKGDDFMSELAFNINGEAFEVLSLADGVAGVRAPDAAKRNPVIGRATVAAQDFHWSRGWSRVASTNACPAQPDGRWLDIGGGRPSGRCCTSWSRSTRIRCWPSCATPIRTAVACRATSSASSRRTSSAACSRMASHACGARHAATRSSSRSPANRAASARVARRGAWRTPRPTW